jgi:death-on-curing protein
VVAAAVILQTSEEAIRQLPRLHLAESALAAPFAGYDDTEAYPSLLDKAAVLIDRMARNHPAARRQQAHRARDHDPLPRT